MLEGKPRRMGCVNQAAYAFSPPICQTSHQRFHTAGDGVLPNLDDPPACFCLPQFAHQGFRQAGQDLPRPA